MKKIGYTLKDVLDMFLDDDDNDTRESMALDFAEANKEKFYKFVYGEALGYYEMLVEDEGRDDCQELLDVLKAHKGGKK